jgi:hypothetical protein
VAVGLAGDAGDAGAVETLGCFGLGAFNVVGAFDIRVAVGVAVSVAVSVTVSVAVSIGVGVGVAIAAALAAAGVVVAPVVAADNLWVVGADISEIAHPVIAAPGAHAGGRDLLPVGVVAQAVGDTLEGRSTKFRAAFPHHGVVGTGILQGLWDIVAGDHKKSKE